MHAACPWQFYVRSTQPSQAFAEEIQSGWSQRNEKVVVLDDDPTGCQTVHDIDVLLRWDKEMLRRVLDDEKHHLFYILTNIRSLSARDAEQRHNEIAARVGALAQERNQKIRVISRGDSTLRGHFPQDLRPFWEHSAYGNISGILIIPAFFEGGRYTFQGIHYVKHGDAYVSADETEFARDPAFHYESAYLPQWIHEKCPEIHAEDVLLIDLQAIRSGGVVYIANQLQQVRDRKCVVIDAVDEEDLETVARAVLLCEYHGQNFLYRTAASFVRIYGGISRRPLLDATEIADQSDTGGLVMVGSFVGKTTGQLEKLFEVEGIQPVELRTLQLMMNKCNEEIERAVQQISEGLEQGRCVVCYTSRPLVKSSSAEEGLKIGARVSSSVVDVVRRLTVRPSFFIAKGGITSHDIAESGLGVTKATVKGQVLPGVPVWELGSESKWPGLKYVVFPGNVGEPTALAQLVCSLRQP